MNSATVDDQDNWLIQSIPKHHLLPFFPVLPPTDQDPHMSDSSFSLLMEILNFIQAASKIKRLDLDWLLDSLNLNGVPQRNAILEL
ncbi:hypothetical protein ACET3Z_033203 [Daucus carota]